MKTTVNLEQGRHTLTRHRPPLAALTGMRFFLAAYVIFHHTRTGDYLVDHGHKFAGNFFLNGQIAVAQFFLLSGFILAYTYCGQIETTRHRVRFWQARFARIWPAYVLSLLASSVFIHSTPPPAWVAASLLMVQGWDPFHILYAGIWNAVCWTLTVEAFFYVLFPWVQTAVERLRARRLKIGIVAVLFVIVLCNTAPKGPGHPGYNGIFAFIPYPVIHLPEFLLGVLAGNLFLDLGAPGQAARRGRLTFGGLAVSLLFLSLPLSHWTSLVMLGFVLLTYGLATERTWLASFLSTRALLLGGGISYSMYLLQTPIRQALDPLFRGSRPFLYDVGEVVLFVALVVVPLCVFLFYEEPLRRMLRKAFDALDRQRERRA